MQCDATLMCISSFLFGFGVWGVKFYPKPKLTNALCYHQLECNAMCTPQARAPRPAMNSPVKNALWFNIVVHALIANLQNMAEQVCEE
jgi:hypothetical protein